MRPLRNMIVTGVLAVTLLGGTAVGAAAAPDRADGPQTHRVVGIEPLDNPIAPFGVADVEPFDNPIGLYFN